MSNEEVPSVSHVAGYDVTFDGEDGPHLRQRCAWCGAVLIDVNLDRIAVPVGQEGPYPIFEYGIFVRTVNPDGQGGVYFPLDVVPSAEGRGSKAPDDACMRMHPDLTA